MPHDSCPFPENEAQRLEAVRSYNILDTPPELDFDALTRGLPIPSIRRSQWSA